MSWRRVEDQLPENGGRFFVYAAARFEADFDVDTGRWTNLDGDDVTEQVSHWRRRPAPPLEVED